MFGVIVAVVFIIFDIIIANAFQSIAEMKGHEERKYFWYSVFFSLAGWMMVIALPDRNQETDKNIIENKAYDELPEL